MEQHELKTIQPYFDELVNGNKTFELRKNDRGFKIGDTLILREYLPKCNDYTLRSLNFVITHILENYQGIEKGYAILSIRRINKPF